MDLGDFNVNWLALGGVLALVASFWDKVKAFIRQSSTILIVQVDLDVMTAIDVARYVRVHYKWVQFSTFHIQSILRSRLDNGQRITVPFKTPTSKGLYKGPQGWIWIDAFNSSISIRAFRGTVDFLELVRVSEKFNVDQRQQKNPNRFFVSRVLGSEKGAWALGEALVRKNSEKGDTDEPRGATPGESNFATSVYEDLDTSFIYDRSVYTHTEKSDPFKGLFYKDDALKEVENARKWLNMSKWYAERSIPHRRGLAIHGPGGTGKSSYVKALAETLGIPVYQFYLNTLSDQEFIREWNRMATPCVALLEDFDNVFHGRVSQTEHKSLTFDAVLNTISGVSALSGVFLAVTTNHLELVDPAMGIAKDGLGGISTRPGRLDSVLYMGETDEPQRRQIVEHVLCDWPDLVENTIARTEGLTPAQVGEVCTQIAYERLA